MTAVNRLWAIGASFVIVAVLLMGWFLGAAPRFAEIADNDLQREAAEAQNLIQEANLARIKDDFERIEELRAELAAMQLAIPSTNSLSTFIGELNKLEAQSKVEITNLTTTDATPFELAVPEAEVPPVAEEGGEGGTPAAPVTPEPAAPASLLSPDEFVLIKVSLEVTGSQAEVLNFVNALQGASRLYLVTALTLAGNAQEGYTATIDGNVYVVIDPNAPEDVEEEVVEEEEEEPAPDPSETPTPNPTDTPTP